MLIVCGSGMNICRIKHLVRPFVAVISIVLLSTPSAWAWGRIGHRVASMMAEERLTSRALAAVHDLLGPDVSFADISTWADEQRDIVGKGSWHCVDVPITESRYDSKYCQPGGCVVSKIHDFQRVLQDPKAGRAEKQEALKFLVHFIEDLTQPLHVGDTGSRGGNLIQVRFWGHGSNLHRVWDTKIIEHFSENESDWLGDINMIASSEWEKGTPEEWATDTLQVAQKAFLLPGTQNVIPSGTAIGEDYCRWALPIIQEQLAKAGVRLAWVLNQIFR
jgi:nuclease S1